MTIVAFRQPLGIWVPNPIFQVHNGNSSPGGNPSAGVAVGTVDATGEKAAMMGWLYFEDQGDGGAATINTSATINFRCGSNTVTWADTTSTIRISLQDSDPAQTTSPARPDLGEDVLVDINPTGGTNPVALATSGWSGPISFASGTKSVSHGQFCCVVFDMTTRAGSDSVNFMAQGSNTQGFGGVRSFTSSTWSGNVNGNLSIVLKAADGRYICFQDFIPVGALSQETYNDASAADEFGNIFQVPMDCRGRFIDMSVGFDSFSSDGTLTIYSDPLGTPTAIATATPLDVGYGYWTASQKPWFTYALDAAVTLEAGTNYCIALKSGGASGSHDTILGYTDVATADHFKLWPCGASAYGVSRNGGSGAFAATGSGKRMYGISLRLDGFDDGAGSGGGGGPLIGGRLVR